MSKNRGDSDIFLQLDHANTKNREFWSNMSAEDQKKSSTYILMRWLASVDADPDFQEWYIRAVNEHMNIGFFQLNKHPKLQWLLATTVSPGFGKQRHYWISNKRGSTDKVINYLKDEFPEMKMSDIETMRSLLTDEQIRQYGIDSGLSKAEVKRDIGV